jgi:epsilon-lactone hydrolase
MSAKRLAAFFLLSASAALLAQQPTDKPAPKPTTAAEAPTGDTSYIDEKGAAHVTRVVPVPEDLSPQAQLSVGRAEPDQGRRSRWRSAAREPTSTRRARK